jgi:VWFA-related protein
LNAGITFPALALILSLCASAPIVLPSQEPAQSSDVIKISTDLVFVDALAVNQRTGVLVGDLRRDDFQLYEDKVKQTITHFSQDRLPLALVLTFDAGAALLEEIPLKAELLATLKRLKPEDEVALMAFDFGRVRLIEDFSRDRELIADRLANLREEFRKKTSMGKVNAGIRPGSALNQAIYEAAILLNQRRQPGLRSAILAVTPEDQPAQLPFTGKSQRDVLAALLEPGVTVNGLILAGLKLGGFTPQINPINVMFARGSLRKYTEQTGGELVKAEGNNAGRKLNEAIERLRVRYSIGYLPSNEKWDGKFRQINLTVTPEVESREGKVIIHARKGYFANKQTQAASPGSGKSKAPGGKDPSGKPLDASESRRTAKR